MTYTPTVWQTGDVITAEKLNKNEQATGYKVLIFSIQFIDTGLDTHTGTVTDYSITDENENSLTLEEVFNLARTNSVIIAF